MNFWLLFYGAYSVLDLIINRKKHAPCLNSVKGNNKYKPALQNACLKNALENISALIWRSTFWRNII